MKLQTSPILAAAQQPIPEPQQAILQPAPSPEAVDQGRLRYRLSMRFAPDAPQAIRPELTSLGAIGLERRLQSLQQEEGLFE